MILFRLVARRESEADKNSIRSYLRGAVGCSNCDERQEQDGTKSVEDADIDAIIATAEEFDQRVFALDQQAANILDPYHPEHPSSLSNKERDALKQLQKQKELTASELANSLQWRLSDDGLKNLRKHIKERMKTKMKMVVKHESL